VGGPIPEHSRHLLAVQAVPGEGEDGPPSRYSRCRSASGRQATFAARLKGAAIERVVAFDGGRCGLKKWCRRGWSRVGHRPAWILDDRYQSVGVSIAIAPKSGEGWCLLVPPGDTLCLNLFPATLREEWPDERIGVVRDGSGSDRGDTVIWPHGIIPLPLPPYSPELNAAEQVFRHVRTRLANDVFATIAERKDALTCAMEQVWDHPQGVTRMTQYPWWRDAVTAITTSLSSKSTRDG